MKAKKIPRIDIQDPVELKNAIPLTTPFVIHIDPSDTCNFRCKFCPSGNRELMKKIEGRNHGPMDFNLYTKIIDHLDEFDQPVRTVRLYKEGEPLVNPRFADMVRYAKESGNCLRVDTTTNGSLLTPDRSLEILDSGLDRLNISVEGVNADQYLDFSRHKMDYNKFVENIAFFYDHRGQCEMNIKINGDILTPEQEQQFYDTFGDITDGISVERTIDYWPKYNEMDVEYDEGISLLGGQSGEVQVCPYIFYEMCINSDGTYSMCRFDWNHAMLLNREFDYWVPPRKIWDSIRLWNFQLTFLKKQKKLLSICSCPSCGILKQGVPENLDTYAEEILDNM